MFDTTRRSGNVVRGEDNIVLHPVIISNKDGFLPIHDLDDLTILFTTVKNGKTEIKRELPKDQIKLFGSKSLPNGYLVLLTKNDLTISADFVFLHGLHPHGISNYIVFRLVDIKSNDE